MSISRRDFLELGALSTTGLALAGSVLPQAFSQQAAHAASDSAGHLEFSFDHDWQFFRPNFTPGAGVHLAEPVFQPGKPALFDPSIPWESAILPHSVRLEPRDASGSVNYQGICWYRKQFPLSLDWKDRILYLKFQGAMQVADVWLNGRHLTTHYGGYIPFTLDITGVVLFDSTNELVVRLDNSNNPEVPPGKAQDELDFVYFGGLYRSVQLQILQSLHISDPILSGKVAGGGIFVTYPAVSRNEATVAVHTEVLNESASARRCLVRHELVTGDNSVVASASQEVSIAAHASASVAQSIQVRQPILWRPENPHLYMLRTTVSENGKLADAQSIRIGIRSFRFDSQHGLLINGAAFFSLGANRHQDHPYVGYALPPSAHYRDALKLREAGFTSYRSHYPQDPSFMDACDELGILAIVSNPGWQFVGDDLFKRRAFQDAREMVRRDRNHPCVVIWEAALNETDNSSIAAEFYRIVHEEYPGPETFTAGDIVGRPVSGFNGWDVNYFGHGARDESKPTWVREWGDQVDNWGDQQGRVRVARAWGEVPMQVQAFTHLDTMDRIYATQPMPAGADLWAGIDAYRGYHHQPFLGAPLDLFRLPKFDYFMFQSQRPPQPISAPAGSGPMVFIANYATFHSPSAVVVFSNCEQVRLVQNGKLVATRQPDAGYHLPHPPFTFKVGDFSSTQSTLFATGVAPAGTEIGELRAEGLIGGKVVATHLLHSPGVPRSLELQLDTCGRNPIADGVDWLRVYARVCDARGTTHPYADDLITFTVSGEGTLIANPAINANPVRAEAGIATALVRTTQAVGPIEVRASAPGLKEASVQFTSEPSQAISWPRKRDRGNLQ